MKPDLVVNHGLTSYAGPSVASAAVLLLDAIRPDFPAADDPRVVKALLLAGASKDRIPEWRRNDTSNPYDRVWGAGELNVLNSYRILSAGHSPPVQNQDVEVRGWDTGVASSVQPVRYYFTVPEGKWANSFSSALTWHRELSPPTFVPGVADLNLRLYAAESFVIHGDPIDESVSAVDNVEHLFLRNLPPGQYAVEVSSGTSGVEYGIAWEVQLGTGPAISIRRSAGGEVFLDLTQLDPHVSYIIESSDSLAPASWDEAGTLRTADTEASTSATWQDPESPLPAARFYRLGWTSLRE